MAIPEVQIPVDRENSSEGTLTFQYCHQIRTPEEYLGIIDPECLYIIVGISQSETSPPKPYYTNCRLHQDLEFIIKKEQGERAKLSSFGQFSYQRGSSGYRQLQVLGLTTSSSFLQTPDDIVEQKFRLLLENINPSFLRQLVPLVWEENGIERWWYYRKDGRSLMRCGN